METTVENPDIPPPVPDYNDQAKPKIDPSLLQRLITSRFGPYLFSLLALGSVVSGNAPTKTPSHEGEKPVENKPVVAQAAKIPTEYGEIEPILQEDRAEFFKTLKEYINLKNNKGLYKSVIKALDPSDPNKDQLFQAVDPHELNTVKKIYTLTLPKPEPVPGLKASYTKFILTKINGEAAQIVFYVVNPEIPGTQHFTKEDLETVAKKTYTHQPTTGYGYIAEETIRSENSYTKIETPKDQNKMGIDGKVFKDGQLIMEIEAGPDGRFIVRINQPAPKSATTSH